MFYAQWLASFENIAWLISVPLQAVLLLRLWRTGLLRQYKWFAGYLFLHLVEAGVLSRIDRLTDAYAFAFFGFAAAAAVVLVFVVHEMFGMIIRNYVGIGTLGRWVLGGGLFLAGVVSLLTLSPDLANRTDIYPALLYFSIFERAVYSALLLFLVVVSAFLAWFPVPLSRNTVVHAILFSITFGSAALLRLVRNILGFDQQLQQTLGLVDMSVFAACLVAWIIFLNPAGEKRTMIVGHRWSTGEADRLTGQLDAINASLIRTARK